MKRNTTRTRLLCNNVIMQSLLLLQYENIILWSPRSLHQHENIIDDQGVTYWYYCMYNIQYSCVLHEISDKLIPAILIIKEDGEISSHLIIIMRLRAIACCNYHATPLRNDRYRDVIII